MHFHQIPSAPIGDANHAVFVQGPELAPLDPIAHGPRSYAVHRSDFGDCVVAFWHGHLFIGFGNVARRVARHLIFHHKVLVFGLLQQSLLDSCDFEALAWKWNC